MPSSSNGHTSVEHSLQYLFMQALVKTTITHCTSEATDSLIHHFVNVLERDAQWWEEVSHHQRDTEIVTEYGIERRLTVWQRLCRTDRSKSNSALLDELSWTLAVVGHLLTQRGRQNESAVWFELSTEYCSDETKLAQALQASLDLQHEPNDTENVHDGPPTRGG
ncbi:hypothetical protein AMS68_007153 [Peltaster fructicola]|uniref:Uncharacterized protein n=1 Tax=Peltaster fructicola TaxID=286661 RepID=A0A6H0Y3V4_9PEZI|nr:hypothetical protein AMS68_007153 [Peltaster fructicola]